MNFKEKIKEFKSGLFSIFEMKKNYRGKATIAAVDCSDQEMLNKLQIEKKSTYSTEKYCFSAPQAIFLLGF